MIGNNLKVDALIVGAGPVGLTISSILHHNGLKVMLIDKRHERPDIPRGIAINQASLDIFDMLKLDKIFSNGIEIDHIDLYCKTRKVGELDFHNVLLDRPYFFHIPQNQVEQYLEETLEKNGLHIQRGIELLDYQQRRGNIRSELQLEHGIIHVNSKFLIGCDGGNSQVRKCMTDSVNQQFYGPYFILADVRLKNHSYENTQYIFNPAGYVMIIPIPDNKYRLIFSIKDNSFDNNIENEMFSREFIEQLLQNRTSIDLKISEIIWTTKARYGHRISNKIYQGKVVLAGDSLHQFSPVGGTNMNIGIQDAYSLAWRIIHMHRGSRSLLKDYARERKVLMDKQQYITEWVTALITRGKKYPNPKHHNKNTVLYGLNDYLTGFLSEKNIKHLQYFISYKEFKNTITEIYKHFFNAHFVLLTQGDVSDEQGKFIELFLVNRPQMQWVHIPGNNSLEFFHCRPDAIVTHYGCMQKLEHVCHSI